MSREIVTTGARSASLKLKMQWIQLMGEKVNHWLFKSYEMWALVLVLGSFAYTGALNRNMAVAVIATAVTTKLLRHLGEKS